MEFGSEFQPGKKLRSAPDIVRDHNDAALLKCLEITHVWFSVPVISFSLGEQIGM